MNKFIDIITTISAKDADGFAVKSDTVIASVRAYFEPRNTTEKWSNHAVFAEATALFRLRKIPGVNVDLTMEIMCENVRYNIISVEDIRGRGMYLEILGKLVQ